MHSHYISKLLNIEDVTVKKIRHADTYVEIYLETKPKEQICPCCGAATKRVHDYRYQTIKDLPWQLKHCYLVLHKRRYACTCGKRFYETYSFLPRYFQRTSRLLLLLLVYIVLKVSRKLQDKPMFLLLLLEGFWILSLILEKSYQLRYPSMNFVAMLLPESFNVFWWIR